MSATTGVPAGLMRRLGAVLYDTLVVIALWLVTLFPLVAVSNDSVGGATVQSLLFVEAFAFFAYFWVARGQTLGMLAWRLQLVSTQPPYSDSGITLKQALLRFVGGLASLATLGLGHLWILFDGEKRAWPDMFSHTRVLHIPPQRPD
jgi:uncharacterized RDD family membrane protein YckC